VTPRPLAGRVLGRRAVLAGGLAGLVGPATTACTGAGARSPSSQGGGVIVPSAASSGDADAVQRARAAAAGLAAAADRLAAADHARARLLGDVAADHRAHLAALAGAAPGSPAPTPSGPAGEPRLAGAVTAERDAARAAVDDAQHASPPVAALLARIAAGRAAHADLLAAAAGAKAPGPLVGGVNGVNGGDGVDPSPAAGRAPEPAAPGALPRHPAAVQPSVPAVGPVPAPGALALASGARDALLALTAGEHAAVFAYGVIAARVSRRRREEARAAWAWHRARRDLLEDRLLAAGVKPPVAAPAYDVGEVPNASGAARLAATVERRLAGLAVRAVAATEGDDRREAIAGLVEGARRLAGWSGRPERLPG
jgi:hypothetical protein